MNYHVSSHLPNCLKKHLSTNVLQLQVQESSYQYYVLYLQWSALSSSPTEECNPFYETNVNTTLQILGGLFFTMISLLVISSASKSGEETNLTAQVNGHLIEHDEDHQDREEIEPL